jgi:uncharacterized membrane protein
VGAPLQRPNRNGPDKEELLKNIPPEVREIIEQLEAGRDKVSISLETLTSISMYRGSWMPPELLRQYELLVPGSAKRLLDWTETQISHRQGLEEKQVQGMESRLNRGQFLSFVVAGASLIAAVLVGILAPSSWPTTALAFGICTVGVGGPAVARILAKKVNWMGRKSTKKEAEHDPDG